jgi:hypothetical protein
MPLARSAVASHFSTVHEWDINTRGVGISMRSTRVRSAFGLAVAIAFASQSVAPSFAGSAESQIVSRELQSANFAHNKIGTNPVRKMAVYLPGGHEGSSIRYPVIYFLPSPPGSYRSLFDQNGAQGLFDRAIASGVIGKFIECRFLLTCNPTVA